MTDFFSKFIRRLIDMDFLGNRFLNLIKTGINYDKDNKRLFQLVGDNKIFIARCSHAVPILKGINMVDWLNTQVYFSSYSPKNDDIYIDIGCGYGHELVYIAKDNKNVKVYGLEANPEVFNYCQANTVGFNNIKNFNLMIGEDASYRIPFSADYAGKGTNDNGLIECHGMTLSNFIELENINSVSLLKLNIEGGEKDIIKNLPYEKIERLVISCHDFRYDRGDGDFYRTFDSVKSNLINYGYDVVSVSPKIIPSHEWKKSLQYWIYASK